jgi:leader peptidase (prepilin peptidase)/N-methyltransferase
VDTDRKILPNILTLGLIIAGLAFAVVLDRDRVIDYVIGALAGYFCLAAVAAVYRRLRQRDGLGLGDAKLLAAGGAWVGWEALPYVVLLASVSALVAALILSFLRRAPSDGRMAFGPFIALAIWAVWLSSQIVPE